MIDKSGPGKIHEVILVFFLKVVTSSLHCPGNFPNTAKKDLEVHDSKFSGIKDYKTDRKILIFIGQKPCSRIFKAI